MTKTDSKNKPKIRVPHTYVLLFMVILFVAALTYVVPAGDVSNYYCDWRY